LAYTKFSRRDFIQLSALAGAGVLVTGCKKDKNDPNNLYSNYSPALVIGTGFGGAVTALRLGQAGVRTIMLERGQRWPINPNGNTFSPLPFPDKRSAWFETETIAPFNPFIGVSIPFQKYAGVLERIRYDGMDVYTGACVGGGSVVYGGITIAPEEELFTQVFPPEISYNELTTKYFPIVKAMLGSAPIPDDLLNDSPYFEFVRVHVEHSQNLGLPIEYFDSTFDWDIIKQEIAGTVPSSAIDGEILYGVNSGAKKSLDQSYLPMAEATGNVTIKPLHQVRDIEQIDGGYYKINVEVIDVDGNIVEEIAHHCKHLFMGAGSVGTTRLLMRSKEKGLLANINDSLGQGWGSNGATMSMRSNLPVNTGNKQSSPSSSAAYDLNNAIAPTVLDMANYPLGFECTCLIHLGLTLDSNRGSFSYNEGTEDIDLNWTNNGIPKNAMDNLMDRLNALNGGQNGEAFTLPETKDDLTYHPLGGAVMGETCDFFGRVKGYDNLYVMDGALIPGSTACANPSLTIAGLAERNIETIILEDILS
jgi:cholesterol oxidase